MADIFELFKKIQKTSDAPKQPISHIVVGLGNPGDKYAHTRHNAGFMALDAFSEKHSFKTDRLKFKSLCGEAVISQKHVLFIKPQTFMNNSGEAVREAASFYKIPSENIIVMFDDISLEPGKMRIRKKGSAGGHNGIKSIIEHIGSENFPRIKIGVGSKPHPDYDLADWVLGEIPKESREVFFDVLMHAGEALEMMLENKTDAAMAKFN
ncbi:MAG: aminoacyl-tRNA hydrolase [Clostridia bacterium]|nr:aminoacyl-tRNA hydrolase [Clostridia bacterium]